MPLFSTTEKIYLTFYDTNNYKNGKNGKMPHLLSMKHIFLDVSTAFLSIQEKERKKKLNSNNHFGNTKFDE